MARSTRRPRSAAASAHGSASRSMKIPSGDEVLLDEIDVLRSVLAVLALRIDLDHSLPVLDGLTEDAGVGERHRHAVERVLVVGIQLQRFLVELLRLRVVLLRVI